MEKESCKTIKNIGKKCSFLFVLTLSGTDNKGFLILDPIAQKAK